jgi:hypothetical protein
MAKATERRFSVGVDYGTNSVRALVVDIADGSEVATHVYNYPSGEAGILLDSKDPNLARQNPVDYIEGFCVSVCRAVNAAKKSAGFRPENVIGIGVDTTGSTTSSCCEHFCATGDEEARLRLMDRAALATRYAPGCLLAGYSGLELRLGRDLGGRIRRRLVGSAGSRGLRSASRWTVTVGRRFRGLNFCNFTTCVSGWCVAIKDKKTQAISLQSAQIRAMFES